MRTSLSSLNGWLKIPADNHTGKLDSALKRGQRLTKSAKRLIVFNGSLHRR
jgi:hypothetical protein